MRKPLTTQPRAGIIYTGPSMLDGAPIVAIAVYTDTNRKTGGMLQTYILRADVAPLDALASGQDASVCGDCKHRPILGGACYVNVAHGPRSVWAGYQRGIYPNFRPEYSDTAALGAGRMVRLGTYGDPAAVPAYVWQALVSRAAGHTGYSHQWENPALPRAQRDAIGALCMASVDTPEEAARAQDAGLRYFRVRLESEPVQTRELVCPASEEAGKRLQCAQCRACSGTAPERTGKASVVIVVHGAKTRRYAAMRSQ